MAEHDRTDGVYDAGSFGLVVVDPLDLEWHEKEQNRLKVENMTLRAENERLKEQMKAEAEGMLSNMQNVMRAADNSETALRAEIAWHEKEQNRLKVENMTLRAEVERLKEFEVWSEDQRAKLRARVAELEAKTFDDPGEAIDRLTAERDRFYARIVELEGALSDLVAVAGGGPNFFDIRNRARAALEKKP